MDTSAADFVARVSLWMRAQQAEVVSVRGPAPCNLRYCRHITPTIERLFPIGDSAMLWTIFVILLVLWLLGWIGFHALGAYIHIVLVLALIVLCIQLFSGRRAV